MHIFNILIIYRRREDNGAEAKIQRHMIENFPKLMRGINLYVHEFKEP